GLNANGPWHLEVARAGDYEIELRRSPREAAAAIAAGVPEFMAVDGRLAAGKALPIKSARVTIGAEDETRPVTPDDKVITFTPPLKAGKTQMQTWFYDDACKQLCGAYFAYVRRK